MTNPKLCCHTSNIFIILPNANAKFYTCNSLSKTYDNNFSLPKLMDSFPRQREKLHSEKSFSLILDLCDSLCSIKPNYVGNPYTYSHYITLPL